MLLLASGVAIGLLAVVGPLRASLLEALRLLGEGDPAALRAYVRSFGGWAPVISAALMLLQAVVAPLPASAIAYVNGLVFGTWWGALLSWASALLAAAVCFGLSRTFGRAAAERLAGRRAVEWSDAFFARFGVRAVLVARLLPVVSFDVVSYGAGLTSLTLGRFLVATAVGMAPATIVYSYLGELGGSSGRAFLWTLGALSALGVIALALRPAVTARLAARRERRSG